MTSQVLAWIARIVLGGIFLYAGIIKAGASEQFLLSLLPFTFVPEVVLRPVAVLLPWLEIAGGVLVLLPWSMRVGAGLLLGLLLGFILVLAWALKENIIVSCSCFGEDEAPSAWKMILAISRDVLLAGAACWLMFRDRCVPPAKL
jgi:uncharacterized membrane protein YphA (DoxX/SURF4 family)